MSVYGIYIYENNNSFEKLIESYLNNDAELLEEGANLSLMKEFNKHKREYKKALSEMKKAIKKDDKEAAKEAKKKALHALNEMSTYISSNKKELSSLSAGLIGTLITEIPVMVLMLIGVLAATVIPEKVIPALVQRKMRTSFDDEMKNLQNVKIGDDGKYYFDTEDRKGAIKDFIQSINIANNIRYKGAYAEYHAKNASYIGSMIPETIGLFKSLKIAIRATKADAVRDNNMLVTMMKDNIKKLREKINKIPV